LLVTAEPLHGGMEGRKCLCADGNLEKLVNLIPIHLPYGGKRINILTGSIQKVLRFGFVYIWLWTSHNSLLQQNYVHLDMECSENIVKTFFCENLYMLVSLCNGYVHLLLSILNCKGMPTEL